MNTTTAKSRLDSNLQSPRHILMNLQNANPSRFNIGGKTSDAGLAHALEAGEWALALLAQLEVSGALDSLSDDEKSTWEIVKHHSTRADEVVTHKLKACVPYSIFKEVKGYRVR